MILYFVKFVVVFLYIKLVKFVVNNIKFLIIINMWMVGLYVIVFMVLLLKFGKC